MRCVVPSLSDAAVVWAGGRGDSIARLAARLDAVTAGSSITACDVRHPRFATTDLTGQGWSRPGRNRSSPRCWTSAGSPGWGTCGRRSCCSAPRTAARPGGARAVSADLRRDRARQGPRSSVRGARRNPAPTTGAAFAETVLGHPDPRPRRGQRRVVVGPLRGAHRGAGGAEVVQQPGPDGLGQLGIGGPPPPAADDDPRPSGVRGAGTHASCQAAPCCAGVPRANLDIRCPGSTLSRCG